MNRYITLGVTFATGIGIGGIAVQAIHAQAQLPAYIIAENVVHDQAGYARDFLPPITKAIKDAGGKFLAQGGRTLSMHGGLNANRVVIVQFESLDKVQAWLNLPATKAAFAIGE